MRSTVLGLQLVCSLIVTVILWTNVARAAGVETSSGSITGPPSLGKPPKHPNTWKYHIFTADDFADDFSDDEDASPPHEADPKIEPWDGMSSGSAAGPHSSLSQVAHDLAQASPETLYAAELPPITFRPVGKSHMGTTLNRFANRLRQYQRSWHSMRWEKPLPGVLHLEKLWHHLSSTIEWQYAVFLDPTPDRQGRILATPILNRRFHVEVLDPDWSVIRVPWAIFAAYPNKNGAPAKLQYIAYMSHEERQHLDLVRRISRSHDSKSLLYFFEHSL